jgi:hypothetical protein
MKTHSNFRARLLLLTIAAWLLALVGVGLFDNARVPKDAPELMVGEKQLVFSLPKTIVIECDLTKYSYEENKK